MWAPNRHCFVVVAKRRQVTIVLAGRGTWVLVNFEPRIELDDNCLRFSFQIKVFNLIISGTWVLVNQRFVFATQSEVLLCLSERLEMLVILAWSRRYLLIKLEISALSDYRCTTGLCC